jgi:hypothetical protein
MRRCLTALGLVVLVFVAAVRGVEGGKELIEPSRGGSAGEATAPLIVTSEPPMMPVRVDGEPVGTTPVRHRAAAGPHKVEVGDTEAEVALRPGSLTVLTLFKGRLVISSRPEGLPRAARPSDAPIMSPTGRPPVDTERRPSEIPTWDRYLTGTSPTF